MVTIRNDIESNGNANRSADNSASVVEGSKNINHLANGSRRSTVADIKPKAFNRKCVGFLTLVVCVGVCFGVGMLFLYSHLVERLNESASEGLLLHDKNGNPVHHSTTAAPATPEPPTVTVSTTKEPTTSTTSMPPTTSTTEVPVSSTTTGKRDEEEFDLDSELNRGAKKIPIIFRDSGMVHTSQPTNDEREQRHREKGSGSPPEVVITPTMNLITPKKRPTKAPEVAHVKCNGGAPWPTA
uniref:Uncharacterized protein n=1 Tax=Anopheles farauti TaxID=69004 RepID=A0A182Q433_9DIPT